MSYLIETTFNELALLTDELELNDKVVFSTEDPEELDYYNLQPCKYHVIYKSKLLYEKHYVIIIGLIDGCCTVAKDICILTNGNIDDEDIRVESIEQFVKEYYQEYMDKNKNNKIYLVFN